MTNFTVEAERKDRTRWILAAGQTREEALERAEPILKAMDRDQLRDLDFLWVSQWMHNRYVAIEALSLEFWRRRLGFRSAALKRGYIPRTG